MRYGKFIVLGLLLIVAPGCQRTPDLYKVNGQVLKDGQPLTANEQNGESLFIQFVPINPDGSPPKNMFFAQAENATGRFTAVGGQLKGIPRGTYRVSVELKKKKKDQLSGKFDVDNSPFIVDIITGKENIVIDLDNPPSA